jgi:hypothetical protein
MSGSDQLDAMIATIKKLPDLGKQAAPDVARAVETELQRTIAAGTTPDGEPWKLTKDGDRPLTGAAKAVAVVAVDTTVFVRLTGPEARHHLGRGRGGVTREVIPTKAIPAKMASAIRDVLLRHFTEQTTGAAHD